MMWRARPWPLIIIMRLLQLMISNSNKWLLMSLYANWRIAWVSFMSVLTLKSYAIVKNHLSKHKQVNKLSSWALAALMHHLPNTATCIPYLVFLNPKAMVAHLPESVQTHSRSWIEGLGRGIAFIKVVQKVNLSSRLNSRPISPTLTWFTCRSRCKWLTLHSLSANKR